MMIIYSTYIWREKLKRKGKCILKSRVYSRDDDCNILTCKDIGTKEEFSCNQFIIELKEL